MTQEGLLYFPSEGRCAYGFLMPTKSITHLVGIEPATTESRVKDTTTTPQRVMDHLSTCLKFAKKLLETLPTQLDVLRWPFQQIQYC
jgi:hypothetical protein